MLSNVAAISIPLHSHMGRSASVRMNAVAPAAAWHTHIEALVMLASREDEVLGAMHAPLHHSCTDQLLSGRKKYYTAYPGKSGETCSVSSSRPPRSKIRIKIFLSTFEHIIALSARSRRVTMCMYWYVRGHCCCLWWLSSV